MSRITENEPEEVRGSSYRLYWWMRGVPQDTIGGPWWVKDFSTDPDRRHQLAELLEDKSTKAIYKCDVPEGTPTGFPWEIRPSEDAELIQGPCPVCGSPAILTGKTKDGRVIGSCGDAFTKAQWDKRWF